MGLTAENVDVVGSNISAEASGAFMVASPPVISTRPFGSITATGLVRAPIMLPAGTKRRFAGS
jgi:hypothetical protein